MLVTSKQTAINVGESELLVGYVSEVYYALRIQPVLSWEGTLQDVVGLAVDSAHPIDCDVRVSLDKFV